MFFKKGELSILWPFYLAFFIGFSVDVTTYVGVIFFLSKGLTLFDIGLLFAVEAIALLLFEIPTGAIADIFGRKWSVVTGWFVSGIIFMLTPLMDSLFSLCLLFIIFGFSFSLISGAQEAWVIDLLRRKKKSHLTQQFFVNDTSICNAGTIVAGVFAGFIIAYLGMDWLFYIEGAGMAVASCFLLFAPNDLTHLHRTSSKKSMLHTIFAALKMISESKIVLFLMLGALFFALLKVGEVLWQPYLVTEGIAVEYLAILGSLGAIVGALIPHTIHLLKQTIMSEKKILAFGTLFSAVVLVLIYFIRGPLFAIGAFLVVKFAIPSIVLPVANNYLQRHLTPSLRATMGSVKSMLTRIPEVFALLAGGQIATLFGPQFTLLLLGIALIPGVLFYYYAEEN